LVAFVVTGALGLAAAAAADEYFTELEIDQIRETQEIARRVPVFLNIAEARLVYLGLAEVEKKEPGKVSKVAKALASVFQPGMAVEAEKAEAEAKTQAAESDAQLKEFTRTELLRGFCQALEETMDNIDDAYERKRGDVRGPLEDLEKFTEKTIPLLKRFEPETSREKSALSEAIEQAELALEGAKSALKIVPKTPKGN
jgi:hypothetical protein